MAKSKDKPAKKDKAPKDKAKKVGFFPKIKSTKKNGLGTY